MPLGSWPELELLATSSINNFKVSALTETFQFSLCTSVPSYNNVSFSVHDLIQAIYTEKIYMK